VPTHCIVLANFAIDFVDGQPPLFERTGECGQSLCGLASGATPSLKPETVASRRPHLA
jgi:hypothetical protein